MCVDNDLWKVFTSRLDDLCNSYPEPISGDLRLKIDFILNDFIDSANQPCNDCKCN